MPRFHIEPAQIKEGSVTLSAEESRHAVQVLRLKAGGVVDLFDGRGNEYRGVVIGIEKGIVSLSLDKSPSRPSVLPEITLAVAVIKPERMDLLLQKVSELGVSAIRPLLTERTVVRLSKERWENKHERWQKIVKEACKQCGQSRLPQVYPVQKIEDFLNGVKTGSFLLIPTLATSTIPVGQALSRWNSGQATVLIGPEGDFTPKEVGLVLRKQGIPVDLGPLVMRTETAAFYILSVLTFHHRQVANSKYL